MSDGKQASVPCAGPAAQARPASRYWPARLPRQLVIPETSLWFNLEVAARRFPAKAATLYGGSAMSYATLHARAEALAGWWQSQGLQRGDRVALYLQNCPQFLVAFYAALRADAVVVPVNPMNKAEELAHLLADSGARGLVFAADLGPVVQQALSALPGPAPVLLGLHYADAWPADGPPPASGLTGPLRDWLLARPPLIPGATAWPAALEAGCRPGPALNGPDDLALLPYTSGTTGLPKGCMHTHRSLMANTCGGGLWGSASPEAVGLAVVPMFHITGLLYGVLAPVYWGMTMVVLPRWDRELAGQSISRHGVTHWTCVPTMIIDLFASPHYRSFDLSSLRYMSGGGTAMPQAVAQRLLDEFGLQFAEGYGLTETAAPTHANPPERAKLQCLGIPIFGVDSRVVDPVTLAALPPGEVGEILSAGPMVFQGYWRQPEATAAAFVEIDGRRFFRTGDLGRMDEEGYFFLTDRLKRMINASGYKVWPSEVELLLFQHPGVQEACVIATRDAYRGESVKAVVVPRAEARATLTEEALIAWAREHMAAYKVPRSVEFVESLPKSGAGKVMWRVLQARENEAS
ncbi:long-chain fatty acid--CoA ligase [Pelomonas sp. APW6]|uniref:Long-chain fatty acid--CoA ligase n=1 Tax=Roseateles subflavus TaxID=3053353 RepID=A0ABT7LMT1_9BURK|nr:long-chain fatty acid--CoA ligase [Pelomonas sp. APW6]MDL5034176.1 long-chain fatty acid--CoA ligase [Pelomonas sp. APW6]